MTDGLLAPYRPKWSPWTFFVALDEIGIGPMLDYMSLIVAEGEIRCQQLSIGVQDQREIIGTL